MKKKWFKIKLDKALFQMQFKNIFKSSKFIKEKNIFWHFLIIYFIWLHFHLNKAGAIGSRPCPRAWWYCLRAFVRKNPFGSTSLLSALLQIKIISAHLIWLLFLLANLPGVTIDHQKWDIYYDCKEQFPKKGKRYVLIIY